VLRAEFLPEPRGDWGAGQPGKVEVLLFPSLALRPRMECDTVLLGWILLEITVHGRSLLLLPSPILHWRGAGAGVSALSRSCGSREIREGLTPAGEIAPRRSPGP
jgi:hypothetical protein